MNQRDSNLYLRLDRNGPFEAGDVVEGEVSVQNDESRAPIDFVDVRLVRMAAGMKHVCSTVTLDVYGGESAFQFPYPPEAFQYSDDVASFDTWVEAVARGQDDTYTRRKLIDSGRRVVFSRAETVERFDSETNPIVPALLAGFAVGFAGMYLPGVLGVPEEPARFAFWVTFVAAPLLAYLVWAIGYEEMTAERALDSVKLEVEPSLDGSVVRADVEIIAGYEPEIRSVEIYARRVTETLRSRDGKRYWESAHQDQRRISTQVPTLQAKETFTFSSEFGIPDGAPPDFATKAYRIRWEAVASIETGDEGYKSEVVVPFRVLPAQAPPNREDSATPVAAVVASEAVASEVSG